MTANLDRQILDNGASAISRSELIEVCIRRIPLKALVGHAQKVPTTIILTVCSRPGATCPNPYGLAYIQDDVTKTVWWHLMADDNGKTYLAGR